MRLLDFLYPSFCAATLLPSLAEARKAPDVVLLSNVQSLTLRQGQKTSHRRVSAIPQVMSFLSGVLQPEKTMIARADSLN